MSVRPVPSFERLSVEPSFDPAIRQTPVSPLPSRNPQPVNVSGPSGSLSSSNWQLPIAMAAMLLGVVGMLQFRMQKSQRPVASNKQSEIIAMLKNVEAERDKLTQDLLSVRS